MNMILLKTKDLPPIPAEIRVMRNLGIDRQKNAGQARMLFGEHCHLTGPEEVFNEWLAGRTVWIKHTCNSNRWTTQTFKERESSQV